MSAALASAKKTRDPFIVTTQVAKRQLDMADDDYRSLLLRAAGVNSSKLVPFNKRQAVLDEFQRLGFKPASKGSRKGLDGPYAGKLQALWIAGWNLGLVRNRDDAALLAFVKRQTGIDHTRFLRYADDGASAVEALKKWLERDGGVDWTKDRFLPDWTQANGYRIARAQHAKLCRLDERTSAPLGEWLRGAGFYAPASMTDGTWIEAMNRLGGLIRDAQKGGA